MRRQKIYPKLKTNKQPNKHTKKPPEKELNQMKASNLPDTEFKTQVIKMLKELSVNLNKEIVIIKRDRETLKRTNQK